MKTYRAEDSVFCVKEEYAAKNSYINRAVTSEKLPKWSDVKDLLPVPIWENHNDTINCYYKA